MVSEQRTLTTSECVEASGVSPAWLRFGERLDALSLARRTPGGHRYYTPLDVERLRRLGVGQRQRELKERS
jgi:DNA-binding transcriptional MerR regulator